MKNYLKLAIVSFIIIIFMIMIIKGENDFGSITDYSVQHVYFFDYLKNQILKNGSIFLKFAGNLGAGQNIYNLSYYGLFSPYLLLAIIFNFVSTENFLIIINIIVLIINSLLMYKILKEDGNEDFAFISSLIFILATPFIFHLKRHYMFINYMPFLLLGINFINYYFKTKKTTFIILSISLILFTSYYYSISCFLVFFIYMIYKLIKLDLLNKKYFFQIIILNIKIYLIGILISSLIIFPTFYTLFSSRRSNSSDINIFSLFIPTVENHLFNPYGMGISLISYFALFYFLIKGKKEYKFLSIVLIFIFSFPIFSYILNGTLYVREKIFIPFIPLFIILTNKFLCTFRVFKYKKYITGFLIIIYLCTINIFINVYGDKFISNGYFNIIKNNYSILDEINDSNFYRVSFNNQNTLVNYTCDSCYTTSFYSSFYNNNYYKFITETMNNEFYTRNMLYHDISRNTLFNLYMNNKYVVDNNLNMFSYNKLTEYDDLNIYGTELSLPLIYASKNIMSLDDFKNFGYPYNLQYLFSHIIVNDEVDTEYQNYIEEVNFNYTLIKKNIEIVRDLDNYLINADENNSITINLDDSLKNKILFISFDNEANKCENGDSWISINGMKNKLTCSSHIYFNNNFVFNYTLSNIDNTLNIKFSNGEHNISNIHFYIMDVTALDNDFIKATNIDITNNIISANIEVPEDMYVNVNIPYDDGFKLYVDDKIQNYEMTNTAFIGFKVSSGIHNIKLVYTPPLYNLSIFLTLIGLILLIINFIYERKKDTY